jgi:tRNA pseudouridine38-40 synthase
MPRDAQRCARAIIEYDGTAFAGSQHQPNARTVQGTLEEALNRLTGERVRIRLAGRPDAGVHASGQVVAFCLPSSPKRSTGDWSELRHRLNGALPPDLAVRSLRAAAPGFDPRRDATWRVYRYRIRTGADRRPGERHRTLEIDSRLDAVAMQAAAQELLGERDFASLGGVQPGRRTVRHLREVTVVRRGTLIEVRVTANAFLRRMVRSIVALLIEVGQGRLSPAAAASLVEAPERVLHGRAAPARGLTLERVIYESNENEYQGTEGEP